jgi:hypothetical protein
MPEVVTSIPIARPSFTVTFAVSPQGDVVSLGGYTWGEQLLKDPDGNVVIPHVVTVPAMYYYPINTLLTFTATLRPGIEIPNIIEYDWNFGDGVRIATTSPTITHTYLTDSPGTIAHLRTRDNIGRSSWSSINMMLTNYDTITYSGLDTTYTDYANMDTSYGNYHTQTTDEPT